MALSASGSLSGRPGGSARGCPAFRWPCDASRSAGGVPSRPLASVAVSVRCRRCGGPIQARRTLDGRLVWPPGDTPPRTPHRERPLHQARGSPARPSFSSNGARRSFQRQLLGAVGGVADPAQAGWVGHLEVAVAGWCWLATLPNTVAEAICTGGREVVGAYGIGSSPSARPGRDTCSALVNWPKRRRRRVPWPPEHHAL